METLINNNILAYPIVQMPQRFGFAPNRLAPALRFLCKDIAVAWRCVGKSRCVIILEGMAFGMACRLLLELIKLL